MLQHKFIKNKCTRCELIRPKQFSLGQQSDVLTVRDICIPTKFNQMVREKQVKTNAVIKLEVYLNEVYLKIGKGEIFSLDELAREHQISGSYATALKRNKIVDQIGNRQRKSWQWIHPRKPDKALALVLMDELIIYNRKYKTGNNILGRALAQPETPNSLFTPVASVSEMAYISGAFITAFYSGMDWRASKEEIHEINETIIFASQDLINKIHKPLKSISNE